MTTVRDWEVGVAPSRGPEPPGVTRRLRRSSRPLAVAEGSDPAAAPAPVISRLGGRAQVRVVVSRCVSLVTQDAERRLPRSLGIDYTKCHQVAHLKRLVLFHVTLTSI